MGRSNCELSAPQAFPGPARVGNIRVTSYRLSAGSSTGDRLKTLGFSQHRFYKRFQYRWRISLKGQVNLWGKEDIHQDPGSERGGGRWQVEGRLGVVGETCLFCPPGPSLHPKEEPNQVGAGGRGWTRGGAIIASLVAGMCACVRHGANAGVDTVKVAHYQMG